MSGCLSDHLQIWGFEEEHILFSDGSMGALFEVTPVDVVCWDDERINGFADRVCQFLNGLPAGVDVQFVQDIKVGNDTVLSLHESLINEGAGEAAKRLSHERTERLRGLENDGLLPRHSLMLLVRRTPTGPLARRPRFFSKPKLFQTASQESLAFEIAATRRVNAEITHALENLGCEITPLDADSVVDLLYWQWNPGRQIPRAAHDPDDVRSSILFSDVAVTEKGFRIGDIHHRIVSLKLLPDQTFASMAAALRGLPFDSRLFLSISVPDQQKEISHLQTQRRLAFSMARGKRSGVSDIESEAKLQDLEGLLEQMIASGEKVFLVSLNILLRSPNEVELDSQVSDTLLKLRELAGAEGMEESLAAFGIFSQIALPNARASERRKRIKTSNLADLLPLYGPWAGHKTPRILLRSRMGSLIGFDPFAPQLTNYNHIVSGGSGSGKSFLTNILLLHLLKEDPRIFIVDIGGSYRKLCENLSGQFIPVGADSELSINPFDLGPGESSASGQKIKFLLGLIELMTREEGEARLPKLERAEVEEAITKVYETSKAPCLSDLRRILLEHSETSVQHLGRILTPWCGNTPFGKFFDRATTIELRRPIVAFDLKGMEAYPDLQAALLFVITDFVWREVQRDRSRMKFLIFDECWRLLESDAGSAFIGEVFRTFRKYFAGCIAISQNVDDFAKSRVSSAILSNSAIKWCLMQKGADQKRLQEVLQLNDNEMALIASLHQQRGEYSESFLIAQDDRAVVAIESAPLEYWMATSDPRDLGAIEEAQKMAPDRNPIEILEMLAGKFPHGVLSPAPASHSDETDSNPKKG